MARWLDIPGLVYFWQRMKEIFDTKVDRVEGYGLSKNDFTDEDKRKLDELVEVPIATDTIPGIVRVGLGLDIDQEGILTPKISGAEGNILQMKTGEGEEGLFVPPCAPPVLHKLRFGAGQVYEYDGSEDVTVPVYLGEIDSN